MVREQREALREAVDRAVRAGIDWTQEPRCAECHGELYDPYSELPRFTLACATCGNRRLVRQRRLVRRPAQLTFNQLAA